MTDARFRNLRFLRLAIWAILMCATGIAVGYYDPRKAVFVPCFFLIIMVPTVLLPLNPATKTKD